VLWIVLSVIFVFHSFICLQIIIWWGGLASAVCTLRFIYIICRTNQVLLTFFRFNSVINQTFKTLLLYLIAKRAHTKFTSCYPFRKCLFVMFIFGLDNFVGTLITLFFLMLYVLAVNHSVIQYLLFEIPGNFYNIPLLLFVVYGKT